jgi:hypothetical protein
MLASHPPHQEVPCRPLLSLQFPLQPEGAKASPTPHLHLHPHAQSVFCPVSGVEFGPWKWTPAKGNLHSIHPDSFFSLHLTCTTALTTLLPELRYDIVAPQPTLATHLSKKYSNDSMLLQNILPCFEPKPVMVRPDLME